MVDPDVSAVLWPVRSDMNHDIGRPRAMAMAYRPTLPTATEGYTPSMFLSLLQIKVFSVFLDHSHPLRGSRGVFQYVCRFGALLFRFRLIFILK